MKTRVRRIRPGVWRVTHTLPYSGTQYADWPTWERAMQDACDVERGRQWM